jgi:hypothetical protein
LPCFGPTDGKYCHITHRLVEISLDTVCSTERPYRRKFANVLDAFAKWQKATINFVMSVRPSFRIEKLDSYWMDFHEILKLSIIRKSAEKIRVSSKTDKNKKMQYTFFIISRSVLLRMKSVSEKSCRETRKTQFVFNNSFFFKSCRL